MEQVTEKKLIGEYVMVTRNVETEDLDGSPKKQGNHRGTPTDYSTSSQVVGSGSPKVSSPSHRSLAEIRGAYGDCTNTNKTYEGNDRGTATQYSTSSQVVDGGTRTSSSTSKIQSDVRESQFQHSQSSDINNAERLVSSERSLATSMNQHDIYQSHSSEMTMLRNQQVRGADTSSRITPSDSLTDGRYTKNDQCRNEL
ncbi:hypothetical protein JYU34_014530 [Plutella xylostella]|uniref:Uncharacterized protein n=1 Tax=Plutella xylostella TaxID=51655 RepID=A0ABQ7Q8J5_PLUXY|nr:hypothetical protein JYU34_014530 [Plutella xylostella]